MGMGAGEGAEDASGRTHDFLEVRERAPMEKQMAAWKNSCDLRRPDER